MFQSTPTIRTYVKFRKAGYSPVDALRNTRILLQWEEYENTWEPSDNPKSNANDPEEGIVRIRLEGEDESYFDVFGEPDGYTDANGRRVSPEEAREEIIRQIELNGNWCVIGEYLSPDGEWEIADSIGHCIGYSDASSSFENWYVPDIMKETISQALASWEEWEQDKKLGEEIASLD